MDTGDISDDCNDETIRRTIRDEYLRDSTVTILLVGTETRHRKHVDWELYSSMIDGGVNTKSGILVINLPETKSPFYTAAHGDEETRIVHPENQFWESVNSREEYESRYPYMPERIIDNLLESRSKISVVPWEKASNPEKLRFLINATFNDRANCTYNFNRPMKRQNS